MTAIWEGWLQTAREDHDVAQHLLGNDLDRVVAFHLQQSVEKMLKGVLLAENIPHRRLTHSLVELTEALPSDHVLRDDFLDLATLEIYATTFRYPTQSGRIPSVSKSHNLTDTIDSIATLLDAVTAHCLTLLPK